jgi:lipopolysaccharide biosynthesis glycosyltransferase
MESVVVVLASNERYFPGLYCAVASALCHLDPARKADVRVLDGGLSERSREILSHLVERYGRRVRLEFVRIDELLFRGAPLGPARSHMAYCRILLPCLVDVPRVIYLDADTLVFRDISELFDLRLPTGQPLAAVRDAETFVLGEDSKTLAAAMKLPPDGAYFNSGVILLDLSQLRSENFTQRCLDFLVSKNEHYRFHDQSAINFLFHRRIAELPEHWNRPSWRFDKQEKNSLDCVLHYTGSAPWHGGMRGPAQVLFERFTAEADLPLNRNSPDFKRSARRNLWRSGLAPLRAIAFAVASLFYRIGGRMGKSAAYQKVARYWFDYIRDAPRRRELHRRRVQEINRMKFDLAGLR